MNDTLPTLNPHLWRKTDQAQQNMLLHFRRQRGCKPNRRRFRALRYWARQFKKWTNRLITEGGR